MEKIVPDYVKIRTYIIGMIAASSGEAMQRIPTERELCKTFDTSRTTLRKALKQLEDEGYLIRKPHFGTFINNEYRSMVNFHTRKHKVVGIVLGNGDLTFLTSYLMRTLSGVLEQLAAAEHCGRILTINGSPEKELEFLLANNQFDAFIFIEPPKTMMACAAQIKKYKIPLVVSRVHDIDAADYCVYTNSSKSTYLASEYLLDAGHRNILFLETADMNEPFNERRKAGAMAAFAAKGVAWNEKLWHCAMPVNAAEIIENICRYGHDFTAVFTAEPFYDLLRERFSDNPEMPIVRIEFNRADIADTFQIIAPAGNMGDALGELACEVVQAPFGSVPQQHIEIDFEVVYPSGRK